MVSDTRGDKSEKWISLVDGVLVYLNATQIDVNIRKNSIRFIVTNPAEIKFCELPPWNERRLRASS